MNDVDMNNDPSDDNNDNEYLFSPNPLILIPPAFLDNGDTNLEEPVQLAQDNYPYMLHFQREHFRHMMALEDCLKLPHIPYLLAEPYGDVDGRATYTPWPHQDMARLDPYFASELSPNVTKYDHLITMLPAEDMDFNFLLTMPNNGTSRALSEAIYSAHAPPPSLDYRHGAPIDEHGYPLNHGYLRNPASPDTQTYVPSSISNPFEHIATRYPVSAFSPIHRDLPYPHVPSNIVLQQFPTGPDDIIRRTNPLYHFAISNAPLAEDDLTDLPQIFAYNPEFLEQQSMIPNIVATIFRHGPFSFHDTLQEAASYEFDPPNINGCFTQLHHNFFPRSQSRSAPGPNEWSDLSHEQLVDLVDQTFLACNNLDETRQSWNRFVPLFDLYSSIFCSICTLRLPEFYFSKSQLRHKRTRRACVHCDHNRKAKIELITRVLGPAGYFLPKRLCISCGIEKPKYQFTQGRWRHSTNRTCKTCS
jgi:hypothetical protein